VSQHSTTEFQTRSVNWWDIYDVVGYLPQFGDQNNLKLQNAETGQAACQDLGGECIIHLDGYYIVMRLCVAFGIIFLVYYTNCTKTTRSSVWRVKMSKYASSINPASIFKTTTECIRYPPRCRTCLCDCTSRRRDRSCRAPTSIYLGFQSKLQPQQRQI